MTHVHIITDYRLQKPKPKRVKITVGRKLIEYPQKFWQQTLSLPKYYGTRCCKNTACKNISVLMSIKHFECIQMPLILISKSSIYEYKLGIKPTIDSSTWE